jgi:hypothetical protein
VAQARPVRGAVRRQRSRGVSWASAWSRCVSHRSRIPQWALHSHQPRRQRRALVGTADEERCAHRHHIDRSCAHRVRLATNALRTLTSARCAAYVVHARRAPRRRLSRLRLEGLRRLASREREAKHAAASPVGPEHERDLRAGVRLGDLMPHCRVERTRDAPHAAARAVRQGHGDELDGLRRDGREDEQPGGTSAHG